MYNEYRSMSTAKGSTDHMLAQREYQARDGLFIAQISMRTDHNQVTTKIGHKDCCRKTVALRQEEIDCLVDRLHIHSRVQKSTKWSYLVLCSHT